MIVCDGGGQVDIFTVLHTLYALCVSICILGRLGTFTPQHFKVNILLAIPVFIKNNFHLQTTLVKKC